MDDRILATSLPKRQAAMSADAVIADGVRGQPLISLAADLLKQVNETQRPVIITQNGEPRAVLQDPQSYESMRNALGLLKLIAQGEEDIRKGKVKSQDKVFSDIEKAIGRE